MGGSVTGMGKLSHVLMVYGTDKSHPEGGCNDEPRTDRRRNQKLNWMLSAFKQVTFFWSFV